MKINDKKIESARMEHFLIVYFHVSCPLFMDANEN